MKQRCRRIPCALVLSLACATHWFSSVVRAEPATSEWIAPPGAAAKKNPTLPGAESVSRGKVLYSNCLICHGPEGRGDGLAAVALNPKPRDLTLPATQDQSDGALFWKMSQGRAPMPPWEQTLSVNDRWDLINYLRTLAAHPRVAAALPATTTPAGTGAAAAVQGDNAPVTRDEFSEMQERMRQIERQTHAAFPGLDHLVIAGDGSITFTNLQRSSSPSSFAAVVSPLFLWEPTDRMLVQAGFDLSIATDTTGASSSSVNISIADASFIVNDYLIVGGGLFVVPFGQYHNHFDPPWIEKLPDAPLPFGDSGIAPSSEVGIFARGALPLKCLHAPFVSPKLVYDVYLANGPQLVTSDPTAAGSLSFDDFTDLNNGKAVGGRIGFLPFNALETGYSFQYSQASPVGFQKAYVILQAVDLNWTQPIEAIGGVLTVRSEWVWSNVQNVTYDPTGKLGFGPLSYANYRTGGYGEVAYRPTFNSNRIIRNFEFIFRYDNLWQPLDAPGGDHEQRYEFGVDYWLTPSLVLKTAYAVDQRKASPSENAFFIQLGFGL